VTLSAKRKILLVCDSQESVERMLARVVRPSPGQDSCPAEATDEVVVVQSPMRALALLARQEFAGVFVTSKYLREALQIGKLLQNEEILQGMPDGVVLLDSDNTILWSNGRLCQWSGRENLAGANFYTVLGSPEILGPDFCPFHTALATGRGTSSTLRSGDSRFFHIHAAPVREVDSPPRPRAR
jgi:PAS domain-containing protein